MNFAFIYGFSQKYLLNIYYVPRTGAVVLSLTNVCVWFERQAVSSSKYTRCIWVLVTAKRTVEQGRHRGGRQGLSVVRDREGLSLQT